MGKTGVNLGKDYWNKNGDKIKEMYLSTQYSTYDIAKIFNTTSTSIRTYLSNIGVFNKNIRRKNKYIINDNYVKGYTKNDNYEFIIDNQDYEEIRKYCWHRHKDGYLRTRIGIKETGGNIYILMHVLITRLHNINIEANQEIDHINGNPADNRLSNLRLATHEQNMKNCKRYITNKSGVKGVYYSPKEKKWKVDIHVNKKAIHLGTYKDKNEAIKVRKEAEVKYYGEFNREENNNKCI